MYKDRHISVLESVCKFMINYIILRMAQSGITQYVRYVYILSVDN